MSPKAHLIAHLTIFLHSFQLTTNSVDNSGDVNHFGSLDMAIVAIFGTIFGTIFDNFYMREHLILKL